ncbi:prepilin peptidase [Lachnoanaerobaculum umeaense]|uniref:Prepilin peptidase n=1 Tax=Lachnoanaerobaculum umeaense TaxID=617123 RepID=A0A385Q0Z4_9FIRM|nr:A24 family peptidase [Lachnoanaerobaculum umeaense]AYB00031.1 prepilin peptidase [Lachnoanaerobaculum umeaense]PZW97468.1 type IV leader peptidase family protein [Lachnoanaerobaculum umeaense]
MVNLILCILFMLIAYAMTEYIYKKRYNISKQNIYLLVIYLLIGVAIGILYKVYEYDILKSLKALTIISVVLIVAGIDYREKIIPNEAIISILSIASILILINIFKNKVETLAIFIDSTVAMILGAGLFAISKAVSKNGVGMGDIKIIGALGFYLRTYALIGVLMVSLVSIAVYGMFKILTKKATTKDEIAFAPFIAFGVTTCMILGF